MFAQLIHETAGRCLVLAHRSELIAQAAEKIHTITGDPVDIEMGDSRADSGGLLSKAKVIVASKDSLHPGRLKRFSRDEFSLIVTDEAHHAISSSYTRIYQWFTSAKHVGVTATPDRLDRMGLKGVYKAVAYCYEITDAIRDGYLVPIRQQTVSISGLDFSGVRTTAGDLNGADLADVMQYEKVLHGVASATLDLSEWRQTLVFATNLAHAERLAEIFNRHRPGCARWVSGNTPMDERSKILKDFARGDYQYLVNVGVLTEGFDDPTIEMVVLARPTKSRSLFAQMIGRGTRPLPGLVDQWPTDIERREAIAHSGKPSLFVLDFTGNSGQHKLITTADILGGKSSEEAVARAAKKAAAGPVDMGEALAEAEAELHAERLAAKEAEAKKRAAVVGKAQYTVGEINPFDVLDISPKRQFDWQKAELASEKQVAFLTKARVPVTAELSKRHASQLIQEVIHRREAGLCSFWQKSFLSKHGFEGEMTRAEAQAAIDTINRKVAA